MSLILNKRHKLRITVEINQAFMAIGDVVLRAT